MKLATEWEEGARKRITEGQARRVLSDLHEHIHGSPLSTATYSEYVKQWLGRKKGETKAVTLQAYTSASEEFERFLKDKSTQPLHYVTSAHVAAWRDRASAKASPRTANNKLKIVRVLFQSAWRDGLISENPAAKVSALRTAQGKRRAFTLSELKQILKAANNEWRGMILFGLYTGQRLKDIASLTWANIDMEGDELRLSTSKTDRQQIIPLASPLKAYLSELPSSDLTGTPLFPGAYRIVNANANVSMLSRQFRELLVNAGLAKADPANHAAKGIGRNVARERNDVSFHSLRHTATSWLKAAGVSEAVARDIVGHDSAEVSRNYTHVDETTKRAAIDKLPAVL